MGVVLKSIAKYHLAIEQDLFGDEIYVSEPASTEKEAVELAAKMALDEHAHDIEALPVALTNNAKMKKRKQEALGLEGIPAQPTVQVPGQPTGPLLKTPKTELNTICQKMGVLTKGSVVYETTHGPERFAAVVTIAGVCDIDGNNLWAGGAFASKQLAEQDAASVALEAILANPENEALLTSFDARSDDNQIG